MRLFIPFATHVVQMEIRSSGEFRALTRQESGGAVLADTLRCWLEGVLRMQAGGEPSGR